jgi:hypothetical protein
MSAAKAEPARSAVTAIPARFAAGHWPVSEKMPALQGHLRRRGARRSAGARPHLARVPPALFFASTRSPDGHASLGEPDFGHGRWAAASSSRTKSNRPRLSAAADTADEASRPATPAIMPLAAIHLPLSFISRRKKMGPPRRRRELLSGGTTGGGRNRDNLLNSQRGIGFRVDRAGTQRCAAPMGSPCRANVKMLVIPHRLGISE